MSKWREKNCKKSYKNNYSLFSKRVLHTKVINKLSVWPSQPLSPSPSWEFSGYKWGLCCISRIPVLFLQLSCFFEFLPLSKLLNREVTFFKWLFIKQMTLDHLHFMICSVLTKIVISRNIFLKGQCVVHNSMLGKIKFKPFFQQRCLSFKKH